MTAKLMVFDDTKIVIGFKHGTDITEMMNSKIDSQKLDLKLSPVFLCKSSESLVELPPGSTIIPNEKSLYKEVTPMHFYSVDGFSEGYKRQHLCHKYGNKDCPLPDDEEMKEVNKSNE